MNRRGNIFNDWWSLLNGQTTCKKLLICFPLLPSICFFFYGIAVSKKEKQQSMEYNGFTIFRNLLSYFSYDYILLLSITYLRVLVNLQPFKSLIKFKKFNRLL